ncbi:FAD-dependent oxidoreductase [Pseudonocardia asaccharolytica]|uniref:FAD-dependent oxidoreductase n=1 Tax=Pseudonocardia asaccharolytica TaxID=54010 RepID=UPI0011BFBD8C|nr:FAD-dependent oxidoreductase [Pseudonocardia asaccharolytica]
MRIAVVEAGVVGLSVTAQLLARGAEVTCYERSAVVMGERSAGSSRIFRLAHATPGLVRLAQQSRNGFREWELAAGVPMVGPQGCAGSAGQHRRARARPRRGGHRVGLSRSGSVLAVSGNNRFKLAPLLGEVLAEARVEGSTPTVDELVATPSSA